MLEAQNLSKYYGNFLAIEDVSFTVERGEIVGFLGPNGAGKTTTMRILAGFMPASTGTVKVGEYDILKDSIKARKRLGYLPETVPLYNDMTVKSYLKFFATIRDYPRAKRAARIKEVMGICRIDGYANIHIAKLSKGYRQLLGVAQAILHEPDVLILDEPTIGIDPRQVVQIRQLIKDLGEEHTVILSSHILPEVSMICDKVMIMNKGRIVAVDKTENLSEHLEASQKVEIEVKGPAKVVAARLRAVDGVFKVFVEGVGEKRAYQVECKPGQDIRDELAAAIVEGGWSLTGLKTHELSLEEIFLKLTTKEQD